MRLFDHFALYDTQACPRLFQELPLARPDLIVYALDHSVRTVRTGVMKPSMAISLFREGTGLTVPWGKYNMFKHTSALATPRNAVTTRRSFLSTITAASLGLVATTSAFSANKASASGSVGYVSVQGAELFVHPTDLSAILYMDEGTAVDILFGPYEGMYEIRHYGTDGWIWAEYLSLDGAPAPAGDLGGGAEAPVTQDAAPAPVAGEGEHWIDVNRSSGLVQLMIGNESIAAFWGSLGWEETDDGFYATAIGTYHVYGFDYDLHYTDFAGNYISHWVAFDPVRYNGFHSYTKDKKGNIVPNGAGRTAGCVALAPGDIDQLYDFAEMNMRVEVHW